MTLEKERSLVDAGPSQGKLVLLALEHDDNHESLVGAEFIAETIQVEKLQSEHPRAPSIEAKKANSSPWHQPEVANGHKPH